MLFADFDEVPILQQRSPEARELLLRVRVAPVFEAVSQLRSRARQVGETVSAMRHTTRTDP
jgi:hypothetical protein